MAPQVTEHLRKVESHVAERLIALVTEVQERSRPSVECYIKEKTACAINKENLVVEVMPQIQQIIADGNSHNLNWIEKLEQNYELFV